LGINIPSAVFWIDQIEKGSRIDPNVPDRPRFNYGKKKVYLVRHIANGFFGTKNRFGDIYGIGKLVINSLTNQDGSGTPSFPDGELREFLLARSLEGAGSPSMGRFN
jgi:hypothetical protein